MLRGEIMRLPQMTTRRWMVAVAVAGLILGGIAGHDRLKRRRVLFLNLARTHFLREVACHQEANLYHALEEDLGGGTAYEDVYRRDYRKRRKENAIQRTRYHRAMAGKYRRAAESPWLSVEPDTPEPDNPFRLDPDQV